MLPKSRTAEWYMFSISSYHHCVFSTKERLSRPFGTSDHWGGLPNAEALGFCRMSLRDRTATVYP